MVLKTTLRNEHNSHICIIHNHSLEWLVTQILTYFVFCTFFLKFIKFSFKKNILEFKYFENEVFSAILSVIYIYIIIMQFHGVIVNFNNILYIHPFLLWVTECTVKCLFCKSSMWCISFWNFSFCLDFSLLFNRQEKK